MSAPRTKRQFAGAASDPSQRQITSFFPSVDATALSFPEAAAAATSRPVLPADTQSNLLNVGMRVRKSVPEGYKTGTYTAMGLFKELDHITEEVKNSSSSTLHTPSATQASTCTSSQRELLPFCGINKVGGLSSQPSFTFESPSPPTSHGFHLGGAGVPSIDDVPSLSSSQDSIKSHTSSQSTGTLSIGIHRPTTTTRKRVHDDGDESDTPSVSECLQVPSGEWMDGQVSPRSLVPVGWENTRVMAVPRKMRQQHLKTSAPSVANHSNSKLGQRGSGSGVALLDQENMVVDEDFPEADFLDYRALDGDEMDF